MGATVNGELISFHAPRGTGEVSEADAVGSPIRELKAAARPAVSPKREGLEPAPMPPPPVLEDWMAAQLGDGIVVRRGIAGALVISRATPPNERLPLFQEAIVLGELRAIVRSSNTPPVGMEVGFRNGVVTVTAQQTLRSRSIVRIVTKMLEFPEVSEIQVLFRPSKG